MIRKVSFFSAVICVCAIGIFAASSPIRVNQIGYELNGPKTAVFQTKDQITWTKFDVIDSQNAVLYSGDVVKANTVVGWPDRNFWTMDFSNFRKAGRFRVKVDTEKSFYFTIGENFLFNNTLPPLLSCLVKMRCTKADNALPLFGTSQKIDLHGGYKEASGDEAKHISHLQFSNYMATNEIPEFEWGLLKAYELNAKNFESANLKTKILAEVAFGADYLNRACSPEGFFYSTVFDGWGDATRTVCAYTSNTGGDYTMTGDYQSAFREGGGIAIAALAKASKMQISGDYTPAQYLATAKRAYTHIKANNTKYANDGKENFLDELGAGLATIELYKTTNDIQYKTEAATWIGKIVGRQTAEGYFYCDDAKQRPYFHAASEGLPLLVLSTYLEIESDNASVKEAIRKNIAWYCTISHEVNNPFNYVRLYARPYSGGAYKDPRKSFFIPHSNESKYWWQGENARIGSMAAGILIGSRAINPGFFIGADSLSRLAISQLDWILGKNVFESCMLLGSGTVNYDVSVEGGIVGGICNGITGADDAGGIEFQGDWRSCEQWLPHESYYLLAVSTLSSMLTPPTAIADNRLHRNAEAWSLVVQKESRSLSVKIQGRLTHAGVLNIYDLHGKRIQSIPVARTAESISLNPGAGSSGLRVFELVSDGKSVFLKNVFMRN